MIRDTFASALFAVIVVSGSSNGEVLKTLNSPNPEIGGYFGWAVASAGDVDGDGHVDFIIGAHQEDAGAQNAGRAYVYGGSSYGLIHVLRAPEPHPGSFFGTAVAGVGDVNNDGYDDVIVGEYGEDGGAYDAGRAYVFSGFNGEVLHDLESPNPETQGNFGYGISGADDVNNDGSPDVIVGAYGEDGGTYSAGRAYVFDGNTGALLHTLESPNPEQTAYFGVAVAGIGDITDDGYGETVAGAVYEDGGAINAGRVYVFDGQTGDVVHALESSHPEQTAAFGHAVDRLADLDDDGCSEIIVGAWLEDTSERHAGRVYVFSGREGDLLRELASPNPDWFGGSVFKFVMPATSTEMASTILQSERTGRMAALSMPGGRTCLVV
jgi:hypothetical protein